MISTGNDIICISATNNARTSEQRFYTRILTDNELHLYNLKFSYLPFEVFVWLLWSVKESAYKYLQRLTPVLIFSPKKFIITHLKFPEGYKITSFKLTQIEDTGFADQSIQGLVTYGTAELHFRSLVKNELIMSVVSADENFDRIYWGIKSIENSDPEYQSISVRKFVINSLKSSHCKNNIAINKSQHGFPVIAEHNEEMSIPVSLSHHHSLVAYSYQT